MVKENEKLLTALASMRGIRELTLFTHGKRSRDFISMMQPALKTINVHVYWDAKAPDVVPSLAKHVETLESLSVCILIKVFPNLTHLQLDMDERVHALDGDELGKYHAKNWERHEAVRWTRLKSIDGDLSNIYASAITGALDHLETKVTCDDFEIYLALVDDLTLKGDLALLINTANFDVEDFVKSLQSMPDLATAKIRIQMDRESEVEPEDIIEHSSRLLGHLRITTLKLVLELAEDHWENVEGYHPTVDTLSGLNVETYVQQLAERISTPTKLSLWIAANSDSEWIAERATNGDMSLKRRGWHAIRRWHYHDGESDSEDENESDESEEGSEDDSDAVRR
ncbi:hypothetical protein CERSUDRAFT_89960 [Gelatoporia subvermispora B]|uniref:Uncharacterized protein n=1 Tax=Ceriporiopsis subvermispora (strain B) TaxID=914234 RepID=M2PX34_CERS8|nr:hypothetical protein CERSUDRAFT_89960 [Gelatoporia subvermispora B]